MYQTIFEMYAYAWRPMSTYVPTFIKCFFMDIPLHAHVHSYIWYLFKYMYIYVHISLYWLELRIAAIIIQNVAFLAPNYYWSTETNIAAMGS